GHVDGAALQNTISEAAGRRARIEDTRTAHVDPERIEAGRKLVAAPRNELRAIGLGNSDRLTRVDLTGSRCRRCTSDEHATGLDALDGPGATRDKTAPHELEIKPAARHRAPPLSRPCARSSPRPSSCLPSSPLPSWRWAPSSSRATPWRCA